MVSLSHIDCSKITDTILHYAMNRVNWYFSNEQWTKYTVADNIEIQNKSEGSLKVQICIHLDIPTVRHSHAHKAKSWMCKWYQCHSNDKIVCCSCQMNSDFCIFSSKKYFFLFYPDLKVIASKINFIHDNKSCNYSLILWSEPQKIDGH